MKDDHMTVDSRMPLRWKYFHMFGAIVAGAIFLCTGVNTATAACLSTLLDAANTYPWRVHNYTDQPLTAGDFHRDQGEDYGSALAFGGSTVWPPLNVGEHAGAYQPEGPATNRTRTWGRACYLHRIWILPRSETPVGRPANLWADMYVFAVDNGAGGKKLMITREGAGDDIDMYTNNESC